MIDLHPLVSLVITSIWRVELVVVEMHLPAPALAFMVTTSPSCRDQQGAQAD